MSLFRGKSDRTAERAAEAAALQHYEAIQAALLSDIKDWLGRLDNAQEECGTATLGDAVIRRAGNMPYPDTAELSSSQVIYLKGFVRSYMSAHMSALIAKTYNAEVAARSGDAGELAKRAARTSFWQSVDAYMANAYG